MVLQTLDGEWRLRRLDSGQVIKACVPGCVHLDLMREGLIPDPFWGDNESRAAWVHEADWEYSRTFAVDECLLDCDAVFLECDGLDTLAEITLNGGLLARADNANVGFRFDVTKLLRPGDNELRVLFRSPVNCVKPLVERDPLQSAYGSLPGASYVRKAPCQWGWDWGPQLPTMGIWKSIRIAGYKAARIDDLWIRQRHGNGNATLDVEVSLERFNDRECRVWAALAEPNGTEASHEAVIDSDKARLSIQVRDPRLWWPNGYGDQPLYSLSVKLQSGDELLDTRTQKVGLRTIQLLRDKDDYGSGFVFAVNSVRIFAKGADWIPADCFPTRVRQEDCERLIGDAAAANMNMLRVWGGGFYESETFYDLCDRYGILVWQDCQFACALYPTDEPYLENVRREIEFNVKRLRSRTCLALWCGNNEIEWQISQCNYGEKNEQRRGQYSRIFHELLPPIFARLDPDRTYWPSSPSSGEELPRFEDPNSENCGNGHFWEVWHGRKPFTFYRTRFFRFMSEFGFQSLPAFETVKSFAPADQLNMISYIMQRHQKNAGGNGLILYYLAQTFRFPASFEMLCYVSQLLQAEAIRYGVEHFRRNRGRCMGTLYWQLNDCWPVLSWSSIDYFGRWKALHYFAKRFYEPVLVSVEDDSGRARIHLTNDTVSEVRAELRWSVEKLDGTVLRQDAVRAAVGPERDAALADLDLSGELADAEDARQAILAYEAFVDGSRISMGITPFVPSKHLDLPDPGLQLAHGRDESGCYVDVKAERAARFVCLSIPGHDVVFSDNYFDLPARRSARVRVLHDIEERVLSTVTVHSLWDSYQEEQLVNSKRVV